MLKQAGLAVLDSFFCSFFQSLCLKMVSGQTRGARLVPPVSLLQQKPGTQTKNKGSCSGKGRVFVFLNKLWGLISLLSKHHLLCIRGRCLPLINSHTVCRHTADICQ